MASSITKRSVKGSPLTSNEVDSNFQSLLDNKAELQSPAFLGRPTFNNDGTPSIPWDDRNLFGHFGNRNLFVDPNSDSWFSSSALTLLANGGYTYENMWLASCGKGGAGTSTLVQFVEGWPATYNMPPSALQYNQIAITTASTGTLSALTCPRYWQAIEGGRTLAGRSGALSVWLFASAQVTITQIAVVQYFGSGSGASAAVTTLVPVNWVIGTTPKRFSVRLDIPGVTGKTFAGGDDTLGIQFCFPVGSTYTIGVGPKQFEATSPLASSDANGAGGSPTPFEYRGIQAELARVDRYIQLSIPFRLDQGMSGSNLSIAYTLSFPRMRIQPVASIATSNSGQNGANSYQVVVQNNRGALAYGISTQGGQVIILGTFHLDARM